MTRRPWVMDRTQGVPINDPYVLAVPVDPAPPGGQEPLVDLRDRGLRLSALHADDEGLFALSRRAIADRLVAAAALLPDGVELLVVEAYRPPRLQQRYFDEHVAELAAADPHLTPAQLQTRASLHVAPPGVAPHTAAGAVDLTLCDPDGVELDMGTAINATPAESSDRCFTAHPDVDGAARANRDLLARAMARNGFVNYGPEWWHWSFGDRYWALRVGAPAALYDVIPVEQATAGR